MQAHHLGCLLAVLLSWTSAEGANLAPNPEFTTDIVGWTGTGADWDGTDGDPAPGSLHLGSASATSTCIQVGSAQGQVVVLKAHIRLTTGTGVQTTYLGFTDTMCSIESGASGGFTYAAPDNAWHPVGIDPGLPANVQSLQLQLRAFSAIGTADAHFDHIEYGPFGTTPVQLQSFDVN